MMASDFTSIDSLDRFLHAVGRYPHLSPAEERRLAEQASQGDAAARQQLVECNLRLVVAIAKDHRNEGLSFLDVIQEGVLGLIGASTLSGPTLATDSRAMRAGASSARSGRSYTAIGRELGICKERVRQIELRALHALRTRPELLGRGDIVA